MERPSEVFDGSELARENQALNEQVKLLVKTERQLWRARSVIEAQLRQLRALSSLVLSAGRAGDPKSVLELTVETLLYVFRVDQAAAFSALSQDVELIALATRRGFEQAQDSAALSGLKLPHVASATFIDSRHPVSSVDEGLRHFLDEVACRLGSPLSQELVPSGAATIEIVLPIHREQKLVCLVVLRKILPMTSFHERLAGEEDLPFLDLVGAHVETVLENVFLCRELGTFASRLEQKVAERTAEVTRANEELAVSLERIREAQEQLVQAGKMAAVLTLVEGVSHELNNPMAVILGYAQCLRQKVPDDSPLRRPLAAIERQAQRCAELIRALLDFSGTHPAERQPIAVHDLLESVLAREQRRASERGIELEALSAERLPQLLVNVEDVRSALVHVVVNALDATAAGGSVRIRASTRRRDRTAGVELSVRDSGRGIPPDILPRIFDPFFTSKSDGRGVGLGLSLARQIIESHGGRIDVESVVGSGTTCRVWLPSMAPSTPDVVAEPSVDRGLS